MNVSVLQEALAPGLVAIRRVAPRRMYSLYPSCVVVTARGEQMELYCGGDTIGLSWKLPASVEEEGTVCVPVALLADLVKQMPNERVDLESAEERPHLLVKCGRYESNLRKLDSQWVIGKPSEREDDRFIEIEAAVLKRMVGQVIRAASTESGSPRPVLEGLGFSLQAGGEGSRLTLVATDSLRLAECVQKVPVIDAEWSGLIVPAKALAHLSRLLGTDEGTVQIRAMAKSDGEDEENYIVFAHENFELWSRLIEGEYPPYKSLMAHENALEILVDMKPLLRALTLAKVVASDYANIVVLEIASGGYLDEETSQFSGVMTVSASSAETGDTSSEVEVWLKTTSDDALESTKMSLNVRFLEDALKSIGTEKAVLMFTSQYKPLVIVPYDPLVLNRELTHLLSPMQIS